MQTTVALVDGVLVMLAIIVLAVVLRKFKILQQEHSMVFSRLVLKVTLPALIFSCLATTHFNTAYLKMALVMAGVETLIIILAWSIARLLKMKRDETGALILVSAFGMSTMLGYPLIREIFPGDCTAIEEAVVTSEFGVGFLLFIFGPLIAMYFGESKIFKKDLFKSASQFFVSPIFISLAAGITVSFIGIDEDSMAFISFDHFLSLIGDANTFLAAMAVGLIIEAEHFRQYYIFLIIAAALKLVLKPLLATFFINNPDFTPMMREIIFIETAMPSALLAAVFARHYHCKPELVSMTVVATLVLCVPTIAFLFMIFF
jgi:malate permease and related proteins